MSVYVIYDVEVTSVRGIFNNRTDAEKSLEKLDTGMAAVMEIPFNHIFPLIDELKIAANPDYLMEESQAIAKEDENT